MFGPGKYDDLCDLVREQAGITTGGVVVMVIGGKHGSGFSIQADALTSLAMPALLEAVAEQMRKDIESA